MVISLVNQKGGVGKTTVAVNLAAQIAMAEPSVAVLDADPQRSVLQWQSAADNRLFDVYHHPGPGLEELIRGLHKRYRYIVVDSPPGLGTFSETVLGVSGLVIVPVNPSPLDIWSSRETVSLLRKVMKQKRGLEGRLLICRKIPRTRIGEQARDAMETYGLRIFKTEICQRVAYVEAMTAGLAVCQYRPTSAAACEIESLCLEIIHGGR